MCILLFFKKENINLSNPSSLGKNSNTKISSVRFTDPPLFKNKKIIQENHKSSKHILTQNNTSSHFIVPPKKETRHEDQIPQTPKHPISQYEKFLPPSSFSKENLTPNTATSESLTANGGDIPIYGANPQDKDLNEGQDLERFVRKDLTFFQFSQIFKERFSAVWNSQERWLSQNSSLSIGDVIYYKVYIQGDGTLLKYEKVTDPHLRSHKKDTQELDVLLEKVLDEVFPLELPSLLKNKIVTQLIAIQVVGNNTPIRFSF